MCRPRVGHPERWGRGTSPRRPGHGHASWSRSIPSHGPRSIPLCHLAQAEDGWLTPGAMEDVAALVGVTPAEVYGTATFYDMLHIVPVGTYLVSICTNIACLLDGAIELLEHAEHSLGVKAGGTTLDGVVTLEEAECLADCDRAPCVQVNHRFIGAQTPESFDAVVAELRAGGRPGEIPPARHAQPGRSRRRPDRGSRRRSPQSGTKWSTRRQGVRRRRTGEGRRRRDPEAWLVTLTDASEDRDLAPRARGLLHFRALPRHRRLRGLAIRARHDPRSGLPRGRHREPPRPRRAQAFPPGASGRCCGRTR